MSRRLVPWAAALAVAGSLLLAPAHAATSASEPEPQVPDTSESPSTSTEPTYAPPTVPPVDAGNGSGGGDVVTPDPDAPGSAARVLVFGDSISAPGRYRAEATTNRLKAWWAYMADGAGLDPGKVMVSAEAGSGIVSRGGGNRGAICTGSTFGDRLGRIAETKPDVIVVEVGRNDIWDCAGTRRVPVDPAKREWLAAAYFSRLAQEADLNGVARSNVYVLTAWGSVHSDKKVPLTESYEIQVRSRGLSWIAMPALPQDQTLDGVHPDARGSRTLGTAALQASDLAVAISSKGTRSGPVASGTQVRCLGVKACRAAGTRRLPRDAAPRRVWGVAGPSARHFVAHALTAQRALPILNASTARAWRLDAVASRSAVQTSHPKVGDVAWWPSSPPGAGGGSRGHVALVERISADNAAVIVSEVTSTGAFRSVRYSGAAQPRGYLRFRRADGSPRGVLLGASAKRGSVTVRGRAVDTDAETTGVRVRVTVRQGSRTWTRTAGRTRFSFVHRFSTPGLRPGAVAIKVTALDAPKSKGTSRSLGSRRVVVR